MVQVLSGTDIEICGPVAFPVVLGLVEHITSAP